MIRKLLSILIITSFLSSGTIIYAGESTSALSTTTKTALTTSSQKARTNLTVKTKNAKGWVAEIKPGLEEIKANREEILQLKADSNAAYKKAKANVRQLLKMKDSLTNEQITVLKEAVSILSRDKKQLESTVGDINAESIKLREARISRDLAAYKNAQQNIISIQEVRIDLLKTVIKDMKMIADM